MELLPDEFERMPLLDELATLIVAGGHETFLSSPLLQPNDRWFPDPWTPDQAGVKRILVRLLDYAGLSHLELTLEVDRFSEADGEVGRDGKAMGHRGTAAWFAGIRSGVCAFGVDLGQLDDPQGLVGTLAHEVTHAYRHAHELAVTDSKIEEPLTDMTTVYLGFGILTLISSQRSLSGQGRGTASWWSTATSGYLSMQSLAYLLGAQAVARGAAVAPIARALQPNQRACFKAAYKELDQRQWLLERLGLSLVPSTSERSRGGWFNRLFGR